MQANGCRPLRTSLSSPRGAARVSTPMVLRQRKGRLVLASFLRCPLGDLPTVQFLLGADAACAHH